MVLCWLLGDLFKFSYYSTRGDTPIQLIFCALSQVILDVYVLWQFWYYEGVEKKPEVPESNDPEKGSLKINKLIEML